METVTGGGHVVDGPRPRHARPNPPAARRRTSRIRCGRPDGWHSDGHAGACRGDPRPRRRRRRRGRPPADARHRLLGRLPVGGGGRRAGAARPLPPPADEPRPRGERGRPCGACAGFDPERVVWEDERWVLTHEGAPSGLPLVVVLHTREHVDLGDLDDELASELGRISVRLTRIIGHLPHIGRVHVNRWGDGGSHFHLWFFARPARLGVDPRLVRRRVGRRAAARSRGRLARGPAHRRDQAGQLGRSRPRLSRVGADGPPHPAESAQMCRPHPAQSAQMYRRAAHICADSARLDSGY